jgi:REP element-mobilizing transposase RayT
MAKRKAQLALLEKNSSAYGGELLNTRKGRSRGRPLSTKATMHLVLRSSQAKGKMSFRNFKKEITEILGKFSLKYGVKIVSFANVGNHLHLQIKLSNRFAYKPFIRAVTSAIAMKVSGRNRWTTPSNKKDEKFWDLRPFTRVIEGLKAFLTLRDYIEINQLEGFGYSRGDAKFEIVLDKERRLRFSG